MCQKLDSVCDPSEALFLPAMHLPSEILSIIKAYAAHPKMNPELKSSLMIESAIYNMNRVERSLFEMEEMHEYDDQQPYLSYDEMTDLHVGKDHVHHLKHYLSHCDCCERHTQSRPQLEDGITELGAMAKISSMQRARNNVRVRWRCYLEQNVGNAQSVECACPCRHLLRRASM